MAEQINEYTPTTATSITIKKPCCDPYSGEWGYTEDDYPIKDMECHIDEYGEARLVISSVNTVHHIPIKFETEIDLSPSK